MTQTISNPGLGAGRRGSRQLVVTISPGQGLAAGGGSAMARPVSRDHWARPAAQLCSAPVCEGGTLLALHRVELGGAQHSVSTCTPRTPHILTTNHALLHFRL